MRIVELHRIGAWALVQVDATCRKLDGTLSVTTIGWAVTRGRVSSSWKYRDLDRAIAVFGRLTK